MIPIAALQAPNIQTLAGWKLNPPSPGIGGNAPTLAESLFPLPGSLTARLFTISGPAYADAEWAAPTCPILPNTGNLALSIGQLLVDQLAAEYAQAIEIDVKLAIGGFLYPFSHQLNYAEGGNEQVTNAAGEHVDIGFNPGKLKAYLPHSYQFVYSFDESKHMSSFVSVELDGVIGMVPAALQNQQAQTTDWPDGAYIQVQLDLGSGGGNYSILVDAMQLEWW